MGAVMEYYVFNTEQEAIEAEAYISAVGNYPRTGNNAKTGTPEPDKQKAERWAIPKQRQDGKWIFQRIPEAIRAQYPQAVKDAFNATYPHVVEELTAEWFSGELNQ